MTPPAAAAAARPESVSPRPRLRERLAHGAPLFRHSRWDALLVALSGLHGAVLAAGPGALVIGCGLWWSSNTIAHDFLHKPFFRSRVLNRLFSLYLTALLGVPQTLWRSRHLAHHAGASSKPRLTPWLAAEIALVAGEWTALAILAPAFFLGAYLPGYALGLSLCALHGYEEHARGTTSHHGRLYNILFLNDGYHAEHHASPGTHWTRIPRLAPAGGRLSRWPPVLRWLEAFSLEALERLVLRFPLLEPLVIRPHEQAFRKLLPLIPPPESVAIVGGGLFPRTPLILSRLLPDARLVVIDSKSEHLGIAKPFLDERVELVHASFDPREHAGFDLIVLPLSFDGDRGSMYADPPAPAILIHDWLWRRRRPGASISVALLKRLNLVVREYGEERGS